jgi:hypothetical protein
MVWLFMEFFITYIILIFFKFLLRFILPLCDYSRSPSMWDLQFSSASQLGMSTRKWGSQFRFGEVEPGFKEFYESHVKALAQGLVSYLWNNNQAIFL